MIKIVDRSGPKNHVATVKIANISSHFAYSNEHHKPTESDSYCYHDWAVGNLAKLVNLYMIELKFTKGFL